MSEYIPRLITREIEDAHKEFRVIVVTGPRQSGKSTLCRHMYPDYRYVNLEHVTIRAAALNDPVGFIDELGEHAIIDEVQHVPQLLSMIQVRVDENKNLRYVLTGSSNFSLLKSVTQSLAGRAALFTLLPFSFKEMNREQLAKSTDELLWQGQYPGVICDDTAPYRFYRNYYNTYVERDLRDLINIKNLLAFDTFMRLMAARVGSEFNASALSRECGVTAKTISEWLSLLASSYITYMLPPYFNNLSKRLTKMPKVYFYDTGLLCYLLNITSAQQLEGHPLRGAVFENMAMGELLKHQFNRALDPSLYFYREQSGREVDAVLTTPEGVRLYEIKAGATLQADFLANMNKVKEIVPGVCSTTVIYDGDTIRPLSVNIRDI